jgi:hypothetical protein
MKSRFSSLTAARLLALGLLGSSLAQAKVPASDLTSPEKRRTVVEQASQLAKPSKAAGLPEELTSPFSPPGFDLTDAEERAASSVATTKVVGAPKLSSDRELLEQIATKIPPTGTIFLNGEARLMFAKKTVRIGDHFTVTFNNQDYDLELVNIDRTTFTLRLNREEITRPIKPAKSQ